MTTDNRKNDEASPEIPSWLEACPGGFRITRAAQDLLRQSFDGWDLDRAVRSLGAWLTWRDNLMQIFATRPT